MKLLLNREDLKPEFQTIACHELLLEHFKEDVQEAIQKSTVRAVILEFDRSDSKHIRKDI